MYAIVGLGNPGPRYSATRHNAGFWVVDELARASGSPWQTKGNCQYQKTLLGTTPAILILPQSFMNLSGQASVPLLRFFKIEPEKLLVVHDELDVEPGAIRIKFGGGAAGHNGVSDMAEQLGTKDFYRVRVGIGRPGSASEDEESDKPSPKISVSSWVLAEPGPRDKELINDAVFKAADAARQLINGGLSDRTVNEVQKQFHAKN